MSGDELRHTQFAAWKDTTAWMEYMKGSAWNKVLKEESALVSKYIQTPQIQSRLGSFTASLASAADTGLEIPFESGSALIVWNSQFIKQWWFRGSSTVREARDLDSSGDTVWVTADVGKGAESFELQVWKSSISKAPIWKLHPVGPDIAVQGSRLYYLGVKNKLVYHELWSCDAKTGESKTLLYSERSPNINLALEKHADGHLVLVKDNSQDKEYFEIKGSRLIPIRPYKLPERWKLPGGEYGVDFVWPSVGVCITKQHGQKILWALGSNHAPKVLLNIPAGTIQFDPYAVWKGNPQCLIRVLNPAENPAYYDFQRHAKLDTPRRNQLRLLTPIFPTGFVSKRFSAKSADGTQVHGIVIYQAHTRPTCLLCVGYGAYGMETGVPFVGSRWGPLVRNGWGIVYTFLRGGGDHTEDWGKAGRREGRQKTVDDFVALIKAAQEITNIDSKHTAIYGRSAGGFLMGMTLAQNPDGMLMRAVYTEVPYVDVLRTTTNPGLPLTELEYNEFGNPLHRLEDFISVGLQSPVDSAAVTASLNVFVLTRTAENDSQVYAYESVKWIRRLRGHDTSKAAPKLCIVERGQGHFTPPDRQDVQRGLDCAFLDAWCKGELH